MPLVLSWALRNIVSVNLLTTTSWVPTPVPNPQTTQAKLPFTDLKDSDGVAVDTADNVDVTDYFNNRVLEPSAG
jgi:hypothetical protein